MMLATMTSTQGPTAGISDPPAHGGGRRALALALVALVAGAALRLAAARGDLWFDELWSLNRARLVERPLDVLLRPELRHDNNHWLNTLYLRAVGQEAAPLVYRLPACVASVLTLVVLGWIGRRRGPLAGVLALVLGASSFLLVQYGSEARGYAGAVLFALLAFALVEGDDGRPWRVPAFWGAVLLGVASHLTFLYGYVALLAWHPLRAWRSRGPRAAAARLALFHALPLGALAVLYFASLRHMVVGGGPKLALGEVVLQALALSLGVPGGSPWALAAALAAGSAAAAEVVLRARERDDTALFFPVVLVVAPALCLLLRSSDVLYPRYFLVCVPFLLLLLASLLARAWRGAPALRIAAGLALVLTVAGNSVPIAGLLRAGRGQHSAALRFLAAETPPGPIEIGVRGDHNLQLLSRHAAALVPPRQVVVRDPGSPVPEPPLWVLADSQDAGFEPPRDVRAFGRRYALAREFLFSGLSGICWFVYRRVEDPAR